MIRQYIGARYVTKIYENSLDPSSAEWEGGRAYEPLTLVTYLNSSYLSKKEVPASIGDPAANPAYWVITGAYNGQIATLQQQIDDINARMLFANRKYVLIGDSYAENYTSGGINVTGWIDQLISILNLTSDNVSNDHIYRVSGQGFLGGAMNRGWYNFINGLAEDDDITDVVIIGGANDIEFADPANDTDLIDAINDTLAAAHSKFPNATVHVGFTVMFYGTSALTLDNKFKHCQDLYNYISAEAGCSIIKNLNTALYDKNNMINDNHPNSDGTKLLACIASAHLLGGQVTNGVARTELTVDTTNANVTANVYQGSLEYSTTDNIMTLKFKGDQGSNRINIGFPAGTMYTPDGTRGLSIGYVADLPLSKKETRILGTGVCINNYNNVSFNMMPYTLVYWQGYLMVVMGYADSNGWGTSHEITQLYIQSFTATIDLTAGNEDG